MARFKAYFLAWVQGMLPPDTCVQLCVDNKTLCSFKPRPLHVVSGVASAMGLHIGQVASRGRKYELAALPKLLAALDLRGAVVIHDALSCQPTIAAQIVTQDGDDLLGLKAN